MVKLYITKRQVEMTIDLNDQNHVFIYALTTEILKSEIDFRLIIDQLAIEILINLGLRKTIKY